MRLLCSPVTHFSGMDTPEADGLPPVHNGTIKLNFNTYRVYNIQCVTLGSFQAQKGHHHQINMQGQRDKQRQRQREEHEKISMETLEIWGEKNLEISKRKFLRWEQVGKSTYATFCSGNSFTDYRHTHTGRTHHHLLQ